MAAPEIPAPTTPSTPPTPPSTAPAPAVPPTTPVNVPRVLTDVRHGDHLTADRLGMSWTAVQQTSTAFGYMFDDLRGNYPYSHLPVEPSAAVVASLKALGTAMVEQPGPAIADSTIPPIHTYWGQFVDHDLTANTDRDDDISITELPFDPLQPEKVVRDLRNLRQPALNLDSVYGNGPASSGQPDQVPYDGDRLELGALTPVVSPPGPPNQVALPGDDLPRKGSAGTDDADRRTPLIGDRRNDENLIVAQLHVAFLKFHNAVLDWFAANPTSQVTGDGSFGRARQLVEWHYQWITVHDFLKRIADPAIVDGLLDGTIAPRFGVGTTTPPGRVFMPLEFSVAAFRFGHSMVRGAYDWNENFGAPGNVADRLPRAPFDLLFLFTGNGGLAGNKTLPDNWPAQFGRLTDDPPAAPPPGVPPRLARKIDTHLAPPLGNLSNEGNSETSQRIQRILKRLAVRNLLRGYRLAIPTGQAVARSLGIAPLTQQQLLSGSRAPSPVDDALVDGGFLDATPLWFYVLREAEVLQGGERLGPVGSRIVAETIIGQLRADSSSFLGQNWDPTQGVTLGSNGTGPVDTITKFLRFAGVPF